MFDMIAPLCAERGISGDEKRVRERIFDALTGCCRLRIDRTGNLIAEKDGPATKNKVVFFAHMDEVGLLVTHITDQGLLLFSSIGMEGPVLQGRKVFVGDCAIPGVIGAKVWHHVEEKERDAPIKTESLYIDIGAKDRNDAAALVSLGDCVVLEGPLRTLENGKFSARALDNRIGCALLIRLMQADLPFCATGVFTCGEEASMFGAKAAGNALNPDIAVILETTTAGDVPIAPEDKAVCRLGKGPVVSFADKGTLYDRDLYRLAFETADAYKIPVQTKEGIYGGNESRVVINAGHGARVLAVSVPCRYLHSASCVADMQDVENTLALIEKLFGVMCAL